MVTEDYVSLETARLLKEKGFTEKIRSYYSEETGKNPIYIRDISSDWNDKYLHHNTISAPTHQMAMGWLREKHIIIVVQPEYFNGSECSYWGVDLWADDNYEKLQGDFPSYEEAVEAALKYVLQYLI